MKEDSRKLSEILEFSHVIFGLKNLLRFKGMPFWEDADWERWDSVSEHSYRMAMLAIMLEPHLKERVDLLRVLKMVLIHDVVELVSSDYSPMSAHGDAGGHAFDKNAFADKYQRETAAARHIFGKLGSLGQEFDELFGEYINTKAKSEEATSEGKFAYALDKIEAVIQIVDYRSMKRNWSREHFEKSIVYMKEWCEYDSGLMEFCELIVADGLKVVAA